MQGHLLTYCDCPCARGSESTPRCTFDFGRLPLPSPSTPSTPSLLVLLVFLPLPPPLDASLLYAGPDRYTATYSNWTNLLHFEASSNELVGTHAYSALTQLVSFEAYSNQLSGRDGGAGWLRWGVVGREIRV
jgi:hypothetical protein